MKRRTSLLASATVLLLLLLSGYLLSQRPAQYDAEAPAAAVAAAENQAQPPGLVSAAVQPAPSSEAPSTQILPAATPASPPTTVPPPTTAARGKILEKESFLDRRLNRTVNVVKGEVLVRFDKRLGETDIAQILRDTGATVLRQTEALRLFRLKLPVGQTPFYKPFHRMVNGFPTGLKGPSRFPPGQPTRPPGQETHHRGGHRTLALTPGNVFDAHAMFWAFHPARSVEKVSDDSPERHEQPAPFLQHVIARTRLHTTGAFAPDPTMGINLHLDPQRTARTP